jgi:hypothetical protein
VGLIASPTLSPPTIAARVAEYTAGFIEWFGLFQERPDFWPGTSDGWTTDSNEKVRTFAFPCSPPGSWDHSWLLSKLLPLRVNNRASWRASGRTQPKLCSQGIEALHGAGRIFICVNNSAYFVPGRMVCWGCVYGGLLFYPTMKKVSFLIVCISFHWTIRTSASVCFVEPKSFASPLAPFDDPIPRNAWIIIEYTKQSKPFWEKIFA